MRWSIAIFTVCMAAAFLPTCGSDEWVCVAKDSAGLAITVCPKYAICSRDSAMTVMQSGTQVVLTRKDGSRRIIERANLNDMEIHHGNR